jgi:hypothetical protein
MLNPDTPPELAAPISGLLVRQELRLVAEATHVPPQVRALCMEHLERRPPGEKMGEKMGDRRGKSTREKAPEGEPVQ